MSRSRRQDDAVAGRYVDLATAGSTDQKPGLATCDARHLMRAGVVMLVGKNPVAPTILPTVFSKTLFECRGEIGPVCNGLTVKHHR